MDKVRSFLKKNISVMSTLLFAAFMLIQLVILRLANQAGRGYMVTEKQELVYFYIQIVIIVGYLLHVLLRKLIRSQTGYGGFLVAVSGGCAVGAECMLFLPESSLVYLVISGITVLCLGFVGGAVYLKMSELIAYGARAGGCIGIGYVSAVVLQYVFQLRWTIKPVLAILLAASLFALAYILQCKLTKDNLQEKQADHIVPHSKLIFSVVITFAMLIFTNYYNSYIHHLQIASGYTDYNVYSWPRLLIIPAMLIFGIVGDIEGGRFLPISALCVVVIAILNTSLLSRETYWLNMCLYYISFTAVVSYYHLTFLRLAPHTNRPALWAVVGRLLDSFAVIISFAFGFSQFSLTTALAADIAALIVTVIFMTVNGDLILYVQTETNSNQIVQEKNEQVTEQIAEQDEKPIDPFSAVQEKYGISPSEMKVLRELVLTDDKQDIVAKRLNISVSTLRHHVTSIYKKTGVQSRLALGKLTEAVRH